jgi:hypothetical protein
MVVKIIAPPNEERVDLVFGVEEKLDSIDGNAAFFDSMFLG